MFTGLVREMGRITQAKKAGGSVYLTVHAPASAAELSIDESVAINGCCQTVIEKAGDEFMVLAVEETLKKTTLGTFASGLAVNVELAMQLKGRLGGHLVLGHVDGVGQIQSVTKKESSWLYHISVPKELFRYIIPIGSIAIDGVSLTVADLDRNEITVSIIPHTFENTNFRFLQSGSNVNVEVDIIGKYIERLLKRDPVDSTISLDTLKSWGYES